MNEPSTKPRFARRAAESAVRALSREQVHPPAAVAQVRAELENAGREAAAEASDEFHMPRTRMGALLQTAMSERLMRGDLPVDPGIVFSSADTEWTGNAAALVDKWLMPRAPFRGHLDYRSRFPMADDAKVALFSDWGTGRPAALTVMAQITRHQPDAIVHLGDIYYSGQPFETRERFLDRLPETVGLARYALLGNQEMYGGGRGYFDTVLPEMDNQSTYFSIENRHWRLIALDSAYAGNRLHEPQVDWLERLVEPDDGRKNILMTHHPAFSLFEEIDLDHLYRPVEPLITRGKIHAWFWGHEHINLGFLPFGGLVARCIGHGAIPYLPPGTDFEARTFPELGVQFINRRRRSLQTLEGVNGFAMLRFNGPDLEVDYVDEDGVSRTEMLSALLTGTSG